LSEDWRRACGQYQKTKRDGQFLHVRPLLLIDVYPYYRQSGSATL
jgi:hypothetical protein